MNKQTEDQQTNKPTTLQEQQDKWIIQDDCEDVQCECPSLTNSLIHQNQSYRQVNVQRTDVRCKLHTEGICIKINNN